MHARPIC